MLRIRQISGFLTNSAVSALQQDTVQYNTGNDNSVVVNAGEELISKAPPNKAQLPLSSSKKLDSPSFGNESTVPSTISVSKEAQAGKRSNLGTRKSRACSATFSNTFSEKNATKLTYHFPLFFFSFFFFSSFLPDKRHWMDKYRVVACMYPVSMCWVHTKLYRK